MFNEPDNLEKDRFFMDFQNIMNDKKQQSVKITEEEAKKIHERVLEMNLPTHVSKDN